MLARRHSRNKLQAEINITPFVDVMLVLLIVFMVTAPLLSVGIQVQLPESNAAAPKSQQDPIVISLQDDGSLFLGEEVVTEQQLFTQLADLEQSDADRTIYVRAAGKLAYQRIIKLMDRLAEAGYNKILLVTEPL